jgi:hypothetical protein
MQYSTMLCSDRKRTAVNRNEAICTEGAVLETCDANQRTHRKYCLYYRSTKLSCTSLRYYVHYCAIPYSTTLIYSTLNCAKAFYFVLCGMLFCIERFKIFTSTLTLNPQYTLTNLTESSNCSITSSLYHLQMARIRHKRRYRGGMECG